MGTNKLANFRFYNSVIVSESIHPKNYIVFDVIASLMALFQNYFDIRYLAILCEIPLSIPLPLEVES